MTTYVGIDVHARQSTVAVLDPVSRRRTTRTVLGGPAQVAQALKELPAPLAVCFEASCGYGTWFEALGRVAQSVTVAHPAKLRLIYSSKRKNDKTDALKLAQLLSIDAVPAVHVPREEIRQWRGLIKHRQRTIQRRTALKNALRALLREYALDVPRGLWTKKGQQWLKEQQLDRLARLRLQEYLLDLAESERRVKRVTAELNRIGQGHPGVALLRTIPGVGPRTAEAMVAWVDDARRFARNRQIGSYLGLVPRQDQSASRNRLGHITKDGPPDVRALLVEAAWRAIRCNARARAKFEQFRHGDPDRKKIAVVATAHWLARVMLSMLRTGECWRKA